MATGRVIRITKKDLMGYRIPSGSRVRSNGGVTAIMGVSNGQGAYARNLSMRGVSKIGGLPIHKSPPKQYRKEGSTKPAHYAGPGYTYPVRSARKPNETIEHWHERDRKKVKRALSRFGKYKHRYTPQVRRIIATNIAKAAKAVGQDSPKALQYRVACGVDKAKGRGKPRKTKRNGGGMALRFRRNRGTAPMIRPMPVMQVGTFRKPLTPKNRREAERAMQAAFGKPLPRKPRKAKAKPGKKKGMTASAKARIAAAKEVKKAKKAAAAAQAAAKKATAASKKAAKTSTGAKKMAAKKKAKKAKPGKKKTARKRKLSASARARIGAGVRRAARRRKRAAAKKPSAARKTTRKPSKRARKSKSAPKRRAGKRKLRASVRARIGAGVRKAARRRKAAARKAAPRKATKRKSPKRKAAKRAAPKRKPAKRARRKAVKWAACSPMVKNRRGYKRNAGTMPTGSLMKKVKALGVPVLTGGVGYGVHRIGTSLVASLISSFLPGTLGRVLAAVGTTVAGVFVANKFVPKYAFNASLGMGLSTLGIVVKELLPGFAEYTGFSGVPSASLLPRYGLGNPFFQAAAGRDPFLQASAGDPFLQGAAGEYFAQPQLGEYFSQDLFSVPGAEGQFAMSKIDVQGDTGAYEFSDQFSGAGAANMDEGLSPNANMDAAFNFMEAAAGVGPADRSTYIPHERALPVGQRATNYDEGIFDQGGIFSG